MRVPLHLLFLLFLFACHKGDPWHYTAIPNTNPTHDIAKLSYLAKSSDRGIELELIRQEETIEGYLNVHSFQFPPFQNNPKKAEITFSANQIDTSFVVTRLKGGQRVHLSSRSLHCLLHLLQNYREVTIQAGHYLQTYHCANFHSLYQKLCARPPRLWPEKFVTFDLY